MRPSNVDRVADPWVGGQGCSWLRPDAQGMTDEDWNEKGRAIVDDTLLIGLSTDCGVGQGAQIRARIKHATARQEGDSGIYYSIP